MTSMTAATASNLAELTAHLDDPLAATEIVAWARRTDRLVRVPTRPWRAKGSTGARLAQVLITDAPDPPQLTVIKILPRDQDAEAAAHRRALREAPEAFRHHFVGQLYDSIQLPDGRTLTFQSTAGHGPDWRPMSELPLRYLRRACAEVTRALFSDWNPDFTVEAASVLEWLRGDTADVASTIDRLRLVGADTRAVWTRTDDGDPMPNPLRLLEDDSLLAAERVDRAIGRVHGDLHGLNLLMWQRPDAVDLESFVLVDLMTYGSTGQLGRDPVRLLLSAIARQLTTIAESQWPSMFALLTNPTGTPGPGPGCAIGATVRSVYDRAAEVLAPSCVWPVQYLVSLVAESLSMASFESVGPALRWWFLRLAGQAARELLTEFGRAAEIPRDAPFLANPFGANPANG